MAAYTVLATRYRPRRFEEVVGQEDTARVLASSIAAGRAGHAFLFSGPRGVGKTSMARILAKAFDCLERDDGQPCGNCRVCTAIDEAGQCLDVVEIDGASHNKVDNVRDLIENLRFRPVEARYRIYIVDEVHMLSTAAFNALLKTLEEPPAHAKFILATTEPLKVPETIRSRCQVFDFRRLTAAQIADRLAVICEAEGVTVPPSLLPRLARSAQGGLRDALSLLDQLITFGEGQPSVEDFERLTGRLSPELLEGLVAAVLGGDAAEAHGRCEQVLGKGARPADLVAQLTEVLEGLLVTAAGGQPADRTPEETQSLTRLAAGVDVDRLLAMLDVMVEASARLRQRADGRLVAEMAVLNLVRIHALTPLTELLSGAEPVSGTPPRSAPAPTRGTAPASRAPPSADPRLATAPAPAGGERGAGAGPVADTAESDQAGDDDFRAAFLRALGKRSVRVELASWPRIERQGERAILQLPPGGPSTHFDPRTRESRALLEAAVEQAAGVPLSLHLLAPAGEPGLSSEPAGVEGQAAPAAQAGVSGSAGPETGQETSAGRPPPKTGKSRLERQIRELWPGAENVDS